MTIYILRSKICKSRTMSAILKNLKAKANSRKPKKTLKELSQLPDFESELSQPGKAANSAKERPKPMPFFFSPIAIFKFI